MTYSFRFALMLLTAALPLSAYEQQQSDCCKQEECCRPEECHEQTECCENPSCSKKKKGRRWGDDPYWRNDRFAEEQFHETGWPGRRGDELSDQLSR